MNKFLPILSHYRLFPALLAIAFPDIQKAVADSSDGNPAVCVPATFEGSLGEAIICGFPEFEPDSGCTWLGPDAIPCAAPRMYRVKRQSMSVSDNWHDGVNDNDTTSAAFDGTERYDECGVLEKKGTGYWKYRYNQVGSGDPGGFEWDMVVKPDLSSLEGTYCAWGSWGPPESEYPGSCDPVSWPFSTSDFKINYGLETCESSPTLISRKRTHNYSDGDNVVNASSTWDEFLEEEIDVVEALDKAGGVKHFSNSAYPVLWNQTGNQLNISAKATKFTATFPCLAPGRYKFEWTWVFSFQLGDECPGLDNEKKVSIEIEVRDGDFELTQPFPLIENYITHLKEGVVNAEWLGPLCVPDEAPGAVCGEVGSVDYTISLGKNDEGKRAGYLSLFQDILTEDTYRRQSLRLHDAKDSEIIWLEGGIRQVVAPQAFVDIVELSAEAYEIRFYNQEAIGDKDANDWLYLIKPESDPFVTILVENPDNNVRERLRLARLTSTTTEVMEFAWDGIGQWTLIEGDGARKVTFKETVSGTTRTEERIVQNAQSEVASHVVETWKDYGWGWRRTSRVEDPNDVHRETKWDYYLSESTDGYNYGKLKQRTTPGGGWEKFEYDSTGQTAKIVRQFLGSSPDTPDSNHRVTFRSQVITKDINDDEILLVTSIETLLGEEIGRSYRVQWMDPETIAGQSYRKVWEITATTPGTAWDDSGAGHLIKKQLTYLSGPGKEEPYRMIFPDGTIALFNYSLDGYEEREVVHEVGEPNIDLTAIVDGTRSVVRTDKFGNLLESEVYDIASNLLTHWEIVVSQDEFGRPAEVHYPLRHTSGEEDAVEIRSHASCGCGMTYLRDWRGVVTEWEYDALNRMREMTQSGITLIHEYDAADRVVEVHRRGRDQSMWRLERREYNLAGELTASTNALSDTTIHSRMFTDGFIVDTVANPDSSIRIEKRWPDDSLYEISGSSSRPMRYEYGVAKPAGSDGFHFYKKAIAITYDEYDNELLDEWSIQWVDMAGRVFRTDYSNGAFSEILSYNDRGQLAARYEGPPSGVATGADVKINLYQYNGRGELEYAVIDMNQNRTIDFSGPDRVSRSMNEVLIAHGTTIKRSRHYEWPENGDLPFVARQVDTAVSGQMQWITADGVSSTVSTEYELVAGMRSGDWTTITARPDDTRLIEQFSQDALIIQKVETPSFQKLSEEAFVYDDHGRMEGQIDLRNGMTVYEYDLADRVRKVTTPIPLPGGTVQSTTYEYDSMGRQTLVIHPDGRRTHSTYSLGGLLESTWESRPAMSEHEFGGREYTYDAQGRLRTLTTWQNFAGRMGKAVTEWEYDPFRGLLIKKVNPPSHVDGPQTETIYTYTDSGRLESRAWARGVVTTYGYTNAGEIGSITYSDSTPSISFQYDRMGHLEQVTDGFGSREVGYTPDGRLLFEEGASGLDSHYIYDALNRLERVDFLEQGTQTVVFSHDYGYDAASGRLKTVAMGTHEAEYGYHTHSPLIESIAFTNGSTPVLTATRGNDNLNRLTSIAFGPMEYHYQYNAANQRTQVDWADGSYWSFGYDDLGQVTSASRSWQSGIPVEGQHFGYTFDDIGNRKETVRNGRSASYQVNLLNQIIERQVPGAVDIMGHAHPEATVTVNMRNAARQEGGYFYREVPLDNETQAALEEVRIVGVRNDAGSSGEDVVSELTGEAFLPEDPEEFVYDDDGNLLEDGRWTYTWNAENRLIQMETRSELTGILDQIRIVFAYDYQGRRLQKKVQAWNVWQWETVQEQNFHYHGWNLVAELDDTENVLKSYLWGIDLSGTLEGAGGVGGLLAIRDHAASEVYYPAYDGNGNVTGLINSADASVAAIYEYGPFGEPIRTSGAAAEMNPFRFSTKYLDAETDLYYYGYRYYSPDMGRWLNRDPIGEQGGLNLHGFVGNDAVNFWDYLGLSASGRKCSWRILVAHGTENWKKYKKRRKSPCGDRIGYIGCGMNNLNERLRPDERIPIPINPPAGPMVPEGPGGAPINDPSEDPGSYTPIAPDDPVRPRDWDGIIDEYGDDQLPGLIRRALERGREAANKECNEDKSCCATIVVEIHCGKRISDELCGHSETVSCR